MRRVSHAYRVGGSTVILQKLSHQEAPDPSPPLASLAGGWEQNRPERLERAPVPTDDTILSRNL
jgi:hypothetical protein